MFERLQAMYADGRIDADGIDQAVTKGWITAEQGDQIKAGTGD